MMDMRDLRQAERFVVLEPIVANFGSASVTILNIAERGMQIEHATPLRLGMTGRVWFKRAEVAVNIQGLIIWSHLSKTPNERGKYLYHSGLRFESDDVAMLDALNTLSNVGVLRPDEHSLERKKQRMEALLQEKRNRPLFKIVTPENDIPSDQALLIEHARARLRANPEEAKKWYNRARYAQTDSWAGAESIRHREDVLAVWEYLERSVDLSTIVKVFEKTGRPQ
jgi:hypothetical protein